MMVAGNLYFIFIFNLVKLFLKLRGTPVVFEFQGREDTAMIEILKIPLVPVGRPVVSRLYLLLLSLLRTSEINYKISILWFLFTMILQSFFLRSN